MTRSHSSSDVSCRTPTPAIPALLKSTSMRPKSATTSGGERFGRGRIGDIDLVRPCASRRPPRSSRRSSPRRPRRRYRRRRRSRLRCANSTAEARPMPEPAPVMRQTLSARRTRDSSCAAAANDSGLSGPSRFRPRSGGLGYHRSTGRARYVSINVREHMTIMIRRRPTSHLPPGTPCTVPSHEPAASR